MKNKKSGMETGWHKTWNKPMPECRALAGVIRRRRERRGWTLAKLAEESGVSRQMLGFLEDDQRKPTWDTTERIAMAFGIPHYNWLWMRFAGRNGSRRAVANATLVAFTGAMQSG